MTLLACFAIGVAFAIAVLLLVLAGVLIGWNLPRLLSALRARGRRDGPGGEGSR